jgi:hypothetical protein
MLDFHRSPYTFQVTGTSIKTKALFDEVHRDIKSASQDVSTANKIRLAKATISDAQKKLRVLVRRQQRMKREVARLSENQHSSPRHPPSTRSVHTHAGTMSWQSTRARKDMHHV